MTEINEPSSDSDLSTSSWTLLNNSDGEEPQETVPKEAPEHEVVELHFKSQEEFESEEKRSRENGFLSFDELVQERLLEHDYEDDARIQKLKRVYKNKLKRGLRKCKAKYLGISVLIVMILSLSAMATLCSKISQSRDEGTEVPEKAVGKVEKRMDFGFSKVFEEIRNGTVEKVVEKPPKLPHPLPHLNSSKISKAKKCMKPEIKKLLYPYPLSDDLTCPRRPNYFKNRKIVPPKTNFNMMKDILMDRNFHALISLIMTNIYIFALFWDMSKCFCNSKTKATNGRYLDDVEKRNIEDIRKYLFKELPFWNAEYSTKSLIPKKSKILQTIPETTPIPSKCCPFFTNSCPCPIVFSQENEKHATCLKKTENSNPLEVLKQCQRNRMKMLKQKYRNQIENVKANEEESPERVDKINRLTLMFSRRLKYSREKYLRELRKRNELKKKNEVERKDVSVGSYSVALPSIYDFGKKFKMIKEKFEKAAGSTAGEFRFE